MDMPQHTQTSITGSAMNERLIVHQARQSIYALLQRLYQDAPDAGLLEWLAAERPFASFPVRLDDEASAALEQILATLHQPQAAYQR